MIASFLTENMSWLAALLICAACLLGLGLADVRRFSSTRVGAIAGVCFRESLRRRVLWITPLAIIGVIIVTQLQQPVDEQDAIRQTIKYCLFATSMLVVITTLILACTNLPKEIDNRVIYTIVTKPATRLEIMTGKVLGFSFVAGAMLLILGLFTFTYVEARASRMRSDVRLRLETLAAGDASRGTLEHYRNEGLLHAVSYSAPRGFDVYARLPLQSEPVRWVYGGGEQEVLAPFDVSMEQLPPMPSDQADAERMAHENFGWVIEATVPHERLRTQPPTKWKPTPLLKKTGPDAAHEIPDVFSLQRIEPPSISVEILGPDRFIIVPSKEIQHIEILPGIPQPRMTEGGRADLPHPAATDQTVRFWIPPASVDRIRALPQDPRRIYLLLRGGSADWIYGAYPGSIRVYKAAPRNLGPGEDGQKDFIPPAKDANGSIAWPIFRGRSGTGGNQLRGSPDPSRAPVAMYHFRNDAGRLDAVDGRVPFDMRVFIERSGGEARTDAEDQTIVQVRATNMETGTTTEPLEFPIESNRPAFFTLPADAVASGNFDLQLRCLTLGHWLGLRNVSVNAVAAEHSFGYNLAKSLFIIWLLALLVSIASVFCSTFVSWPIAVVLTLVILLGRWGVDQLGESGPGLGRSVISDFFPGTDPATAKTISSSVEGLSTMLNTVAKVLPDISRFEVTDHIDRGINIPHQVVFDALTVIALFGLPLLSLGYVFLKLKEVAP